MSRAQTIRSSEIQFDGKFPPQRAMAYIAATAAAVPFNYFICPSAGTVKLKVRVITALTHATSDLEVGIQGNDDSILESHDIQNLAAGYYDLSQATEVQSLAVNEGDVVFWTLTGGDTTGALVAETQFFPT